MEQAKNSLGRMENAKENLQFLIEKSQGEISDAEAKNLEIFDKYRQQFIEAMDDDLNTADAISAMFELITAINTAVKETALFAPLSKAADMNGGILSQKEFVKSLKNRKLWLAKNAELLSEVRASTRQLTSTQVEVKFDNISKDRSKIEELIQLESGGKHIKLSNKIGRAHV